MTPFLNSGALARAARNLFSRPRVFNGFFALACAAALAVPGQLFAVTVADSAAVQYNRDVRPILTENCFACHGPDSASRKGGLRLDHFDDAIASRKGSPAIVPGKPDASEMIHRITAPDPDDIMPPTKTEKKLTPKQKDILRQWIASGAKYQLLWSLIAPVRPELPKVRDNHWVRNPIDNFILARLEKEGLKPAPEADRRTLARRVSLDLTGLPPSPAEVEAFVQDKSPNAYEKLVDHLLKSPHYGEQRAHYWLDAARYGDSNGIHFDNYREMWSYRDWVINAFNRNESFDKFTIEQLAGDLIPHHTLEQEIASGFNRCNITSNEGGAIDEEYLVLYARDRTQTTSQVWLGLTAGCAVCHDHKFDPLSQKEFYSLSAFFNNTTQKAMDGNVKDTPPTVEVPMMADRPTWNALKGEKTEAEAAIKERRETGHTNFDAWLAGNPMDTFTKNLPKDEPLFHAALSDDQPRSLKINFNGESRQISVATNAAWQEGVVASNAYTTSQATTPVIADVGDFEKDQAFSYGAWVYLTTNRDGALFSRMDDHHDYRGWDLWIEGGKPAADIINKWSDDAIKIVSDKAIEANHWTHVFVTYDGSAKASGVKIYLDGELQKTTVQADKLASTIRTTVPFKIGQRSSSQAVNGAGIEDLRIYKGVLPEPEIQALAMDSRMAWLLSKPAKDRSKKDSEYLYDTWLARVDLPYQAAAARMAALEKEEMEIKSRGTEALVMHERTNAASAYVLFRGDYDKRREEVFANTPAALPPMPADFPHNRLGFAKWLMLPQNPLTARVTVNRFWQQIFGQGIVRTTGDFGVTGEMPSHPELLDWLAVDFRESGWDMKRFFKQIVMSAAYRQAAIITPDKLEKDPANLLVSRGPRFRMDAEMIRDYALSASGMLAPKIGGPSVKPYQPGGVWEAVAMDVSNTRIYKQDTGDSLYRRSLYTFWKRAAPPASMEIFDAPSRETCTVHRERGDTPLQALVTLDDPQFIEAARHLAQLALEKKDVNEKGRLNFMAERLLDRPLRPQERKITDGVLKKLETHYQADPKDAAELLSVGESKADPSLDKPSFAAYTMVANELMNMDEVLNK
jgi:mono/diheme cytochrome c family protein